MIAQFYDQLTPYYPLIYVDWNQSIRKQASVLHQIIQKYLGHEPASSLSILDAACGIGTQALGLAALGYQVTASDISRGEVERAQAEASNRGLTINFRLADMRHLWQTHQRRFDVVLACDNAIPHLTNDADIAQAFAQFYQCTAANGLGLISVRDYANLQRGGRQLHPRRAHAIPNGQLVLFDLWEFEDDAHYHITTYVVEDTGSPAPKTTAIRGGRYYCVELPTLQCLMEQAGFYGVEVIQDRFFQPILIGRKGK